MSDARDRIEEEIGDGEYGPGVFDEPTTYRPEKGDDDTGLSSTLAAGTDTEQLQDGGPHDTPGVATTTGGHASRTASGATRGTAPAWPTRPPATRPRAPWRPRWTATPATRAATRSTDRGVPRRRPLASLG